MRPARAAADRLPASLIDVLVVASWFPGYADPAAGRFVADQVDALAATGCARPVAISFERSRLSGGARSRGLQAATVSAAGVDGTRENPRLFVRGVPGLTPAVPVARLTIPEGLTLDAGRTHSAVHRATALSALADRLMLTADPARGSARGVVHAHTGYPDGVAAITLADRLRWPLFVTEHASFVGRQIAEPEIRDAYAAMLARVERLYAVSTMLADELRAAFPEFASTIEVLPNAVPMDAFPVAGLADRTPDELLYVGYRVASKGIETLLRAVALARRERPSITLRLIGRAPTQDLDRRWLALAEDLGIADGVTLESSSDRAGVASAMARASILVHPSPRETFGVVAVEALATGTPVVATDSGGVTEILGAQPGNLGALTPRDDPAALAGAIVDTLEHRDRFDPAALRAAVETRFGASVVAQRLLVDYEASLQEESQVAARHSIVVPEASKPRSHRPIVVVALDRSSAEARLGPVPDPTRASLTLVTSKEPRDQPVPSVGRLVEVGVAPPSTASPSTGLRRRRGIVGRIARLLVDPVGTLNRQLGRDPGSARALVAATDAVERLAREIGPIDVIAVDGHDHLALAGRVTTARVRRSGGGLAWLVDDRGVAPEGSASGSPSRARDP